MNGFEDAARIAAADQALARLNRLLDAMIHAWLISRPMLAAANPDPMAQLASLSYTLFAAANPDEARALAQRCQVDMPLLPDEELLSPNDLPCLLAVAINRLSQRLEGAVPDREFIDDQGRRWEWCGGQPGTWAWRCTGVGVQP